MKKQIKKNILKSFLRVGIIIIGFGTLVNVGYSFDWTQGWAKVTNGDLIDAELLNKFSDGLDALFSSFKVDKSTDEVRMKRNLNMSGHDLIGVGFDDLEDGATFQQGIDDKYVNVGGDTMTGDLNIGNGSNLNVEGAIGIKTTSPDIDLAIGDSDTGLSEGSTANSLDFHAGSSTTPVATLNTNGIEMGTNRNINLDGGQIDMGGNRITNLADPSFGSDAARLQDTINGISCNDGQSIIWSGTNTNGNWVCEGSTNSGSDPGDYDEILEDGYYVISTDNSTYVNGCNSSGLNNPNEKCILYIKGSGIYVAPGSTDRILGHWEGFNYLSDNYDCKNDSQTCQLVKEVSEVTTAPGYCNSLSIGGKDWYLPPRDSQGLSTMHVNEGELKSIDYSAWYRSSTFYHYYNYEIDARWRARQLGGDSTNYYLRGDARRVRCIAK